MNQDPNTWKTGDRLVYVNEHKSGRYIHSPYEMWGLPLGTIFECIKVDHNDVWIKHPDRKLDPNNENLEYPDKTYCCFDPAHFKREHPFVTLVEKVTRTNQDIP